MAPQDVKIHCSYRIEKNLRRMGASDGSSCKSVKSADSEFICVEEGVDQFTPFSPKSPNAVIHWDADEDDGVDAINCCDDDGDDNINNKIDENGEQTENSKYDDLEMNVQNHQRQSRVKPGNGTARKRKLESDLAHIKKFHRKNFVGKRRRSFF